MDVSEGVFVKGGELGLVAADQVSETYDAHYLVRNWNVRVAGAGRCLAR